MNTKTLNKVLEQLAIDDEGRACRDIPEAACKEQPRNIVMHVFSLALSKSADSLIDPKLVLAWLLKELGASVAFIGLLVPVREAGALLPQLFTADLIRKLKKRKFVWATGSLVQGIAALMMGLVAFASPNGPVAGLAIVSLLAILALARSACSVSYKDVLGKTVSLARRGKATGLAGSLAAIVAISYGIALSTGIVPRMTLVVSGLFLAGGFWMLAAATFSTLKEEAGASEGGGRMISAALSNLGYLRSERQLRLFILTRGLLTATALAPPFMIAAGSAKDTEGVGGLGFLLLASAFASLVSSYVWGRLADSSSRKVLMLSAFASAVILAVYCALLVAELDGNTFLLPVCLFFVMVSYQGVRLGRSTHLVDMANEETRAPFTAVSNTVIGLLLLLGGLFSVVAQLTGALPVLTIMCVMCAGGVAAAYALKEVQETRER